MDLNPDTVGQASCRKNGVSMGVTETLVELTACDLVLSGPSITFYAAFVYVRRLSLDLETAPGGRR